MFGFRRFIRQYWSCMLPCVLNELLVKLGWKTWDREEKPSFSSRLPLSRHIARFATFFIDLGILISLYASAHHPYTTLATGEWRIFWPSEDNPIEVGSTECSWHFVFQSSLHVRLLPAILQWRKNQKHLRCRCLGGSAVALNKFVQLASISWVSSSNKLSWSI